MPSKQFQSALRIISYVQSFQLLKRIGDSAMARIAFSFLLERSEKIWCNNWWEFSSILSRMMVATRPMKPYLFAVVFFIFLFFQSKSEVLQPVFQYLHLMYKCFLFSYQV